MRDWEEFIVSILHRDAWGMAACDYFQQLRPRPPADSPSHFLDWISERFGGHASDMVHFHRVLISLADQLGEFDAFAVASRSVRLLARTGKLADRTLVDACAGHFVPFRSEKTFRDVLAAQRRKDATAPSTNETRGLAKKRIPQKRAQAAEREADDGSLDARLRRSLQQMAVEAKPAERGTAYDADFESSAVRKALQFLEVAAARGVGLANAVVVSLGGANGAEVDAILRKSECSRGVLIELSHESCDIARARASKLSKDLSGKTISVYEGNAEHAWAQARPAIEKLVEGGVVDTVAFSINAVLHELASRGGAFDLRRFVHSLVADWECCLVVLREPRRPSEWPDDVEMSVGTVEARTLLALVKAVSDRAKTEVELTAGDFVRCKSEAAVEALFKLAYHADLAYEMEERVTALAHSELVSVFSLEFGEYDVEVRQFNSMSFEKLYKEHRVRVRNRDGVALPKPAVFSLLTAYRSPEAKDAAISP